MSKNFHKPPPVINSARTLCYAINDASITFTGRINLFVGDNKEKLGEMPLLAICENYCVPDDILLLFCDENWNPQGVIADKSIDALKKQAEVGYAGTSDKWVNAEASKEELDKFLREHYQVDPDSEWWKLVCAFCGKDDMEVEHMLGSEDGKTYICDNCVKSLYDYLIEDDEEEAS